MPAEQPLHPWEGPMHLLATTPHAFWVRLLRGALLCLPVAFALVAYGTVAYFAFGQFIHLDRLWDKQTRLGIFESRIAGVGDEMLRRSPKLRDLLDEFAACKPDCPPQLFQRRDALIRLAWPEVFPRLMVEKDWGTLLLSEGSHKQFLEIVQKHGSGGALLKCVPKLGFYYGRKNETPYALFEGFDCSASGRPGG